jgi:hypothetical protein
VLAALLIGTKLGIPCTQLNDVRESLSSLLKPRKS